MAWLSWFRPRSIRAATLLVLAVTLILGQAVGLAFYGYDRWRLARQVEGQEFRHRLDIVQKVIAAAPEASRDQIVQALNAAGFSIHIAPLGPIQPPSAPTLPSLPEIPNFPSFHAGHTPPAAPPPPLAPLAVVKNGVVVVDLARQQSEMIARLQADLARQVEETMAPLRDMDAAMGEALRLAEDTRRSSDALTEQVRQQIRAARDEVREQIQEARAQVNEASRRLRLAQAEAARSRDPEARAAALEDAADAQGDIDEATREIERLSRQAAEGAIRVRMTLPGAREVAQVTAAPLQASFDLTRFAVVFALCASLVLGLGWWATRRVTAPLAMFSDAAERLGRNAEGPPLPEDGPTEVRQAAAAFNRMQARVSRFIADRTTMLAAISHDLRTPLTRMRLRVEFVADDQDRAKMIADLDEMEAMIAEALAFARNEAETEPAQALDLQDLAQAVAEDQRVVGADVQVAPGTPAMVQARPSGLRRALTNVTRNAVLYGQRARLSVEARADGFELHVDDDGPGIAEADRERVFQPFTRLEASRNKSLGGVGLGLTVARATLRAHGGDILLANRPQGGLRVTLVLPAALKQAVDEARA